MAALHDQVAACEHERVGVAHTCREQPLGVEHVIPRAHYARVERCNVIDLVLLVPVFLKHELVEIVVLSNCEEVPDRVAALAQKPGVLGDDSFRAPDIQFLNFRKKTTSCF
ncbi:hypothetical protein J3U02_09005 [Bifidobacterium sp. B4077]|nr:hypothetical protein [Bifidobacterium sp. B4077]